MVNEVLGYPVYVFIQVGEFVVVTHVYHSYFVLFMGFQTCVNLIILDI